VPCRRPDQRVADPEEALDRAPVTGIERVDQVAVTATLTGKVPPEPMTWRWISRSPFGEKTVTVLLPAFTAYSSPRARSKARKPWEPRWSTTDPVPMRAPAVR
jgi:hypothetical protein